jgi:hypothetical protein
MEKKRSNPTLDIRSAKLGLRAFDAKTRRPPERPHLGDANRGAAQTAPRFISSISEAKIEKAALMRRAPAFAACAPQKTRNNP